MAPLSSSKSSQMATIIRMKHQREGASIIRFFPRQLVQHSNNINLIREHRNFTTIKGDYLISTILSMMTTQPNLNHSYPWITIKSMLKLTLISYLKEGWRWFRSSNCFSHLRIKMAETQILPSFTQWMFKNIRGWRLQLMIFFQHLQKIWKPQIINSQMSPKNQF